ncbi:hypothetical protein DOM22_08505 [Bdellovibrio sp. ZAP7]|uniref:DUF6976 family protein n=1 Tax=Bdellovibrio sp. ZAP7 TaxID=2231053 RepID=UPI00115B1A73|nr:hypothetical protein [Bdellovibrio sp. ZAP7]QDK45194.1 hypothetical protein DOM22_08505 [Bdellovibrio sp. ZAP7]
MKSLLKVNEVVELIKSGKKLVLAADEKLLMALPKGQWIGGTIPYFMSENGGIETTELIQVGVLPDFVEHCTVIHYRADKLHKIPSDYEQNGVSFIMIPAFSNAHFEFAKNCSSYQGIFDHPLLGWITGYQLGQTVLTKPKTFNGLTGEFSEDGALVMHLNLREDKFGKVNIINIFNQGSGDAISFKETGFEVSSCLVNGVETSFFDYIKSNNINTQLPLVANYSGAAVNVSIMTLNEDKRTVSLYAPVFPGVDYKIAAAVESYEGEFEKHVSRMNLTKPTLSCNCVLNYLYANLEGKKTANILGPMTFGEIAYMLLNQTMVYVTFEDKVAP